MHLCSCGGGKSQPAKQASKHSWPSSATVCPAKKSSIITIIIIAFGLILFSPSMPQILTILQTAVNIVQNFGPRLEYVPTLKFGTFELSP
ncbi:Uncharacterized protein TCM_028642 [Theobroma cacao]|uniref:Uncharacterized protein n=1 Tax=Theobroma cacao TaxID=3641 RepID=A0A061GBD3_THECC|nr:Uncharacterized protein TCM_028642 [Theobroma cacao]